MLGSARRACRNVSVSCHRRSGPRRESQGRHDEFLGGKAGNEGDAQLPVEAEGLYRRFDEFPDPAGEAVLEPIFSQLLVSGAGGRLSVLGAGKLVMTQISTEATSMTVPAFFM